MASGSKRQDSGAASSVQAEEEVAAQGQNGNPQQFKGGLQARRRGTHTHTPPSSPAPSPRLLALSLHGLAECQLCSLPQAYLSPLPALPLALILCFRLLWGCGATSGASCSPGPTLGPTPEVLASEVPEAIQSFLWGWAGVKWG